MSGPRRQRQSPERRARSDDARRNRLSEPQPGPRFTPPCPQPGLKSSHLLSAGEIRRQHGVFTASGIPDSHVARAPGNEEAVSSDVDGANPGPATRLALFRARPLSAIHSSATWRPTTLDVANSNFQAGWYSRNLSQGLRGVDRERTRVCDALRERGLVGANGYRQRVQRA